MGAFNWDPMRYEKAQVLSISGCGPAEGVYVISDVDEKPDGSTTLTLIAEPEELSGI
jgi:hypothetical protein